jgi:hypothetical protein
MIALFFATNPKMRLLILQVAELEWRFTRDYMNMANIIDSYNTGKSNPGYLLSEI